jgi:23S rRNA pseudouridine2605 synthase
MNHQVKKMFKAVGFPVIKLSREAYGNLTLAGLQPGEHRPIKPQELHDLRQLTGEQEEAH